MKMNTRIERTLKRVVACAALGAGLLAGRPSTGASFDFLFNVNKVSDDRQFFLNLTVGDSGVDRRVLEPALPRLRNVEVDLPVVLFLARESRRPATINVGAGRGSEPMSTFHPANMRPSAASSASAVPGATCSR